MLSRPAAADGSGPLALEERDDPRPGPGELLVRVEACAVCRTDLQLAEGDLAARRLPIVPGHQAVGRVEAVGRGRRRAGAGRPRRRPWLAGADGVCDQCRAGRENLCAGARSPAGTSTAGSRSRIAVRADFALRPPDGFDDVAAAPLLCGGVIGFRSLRVAGVVPGGRLGLYGFGASALLAMQVARTGAARARLHALGGRARAGRRAGRRVGGRLRRRAAGAAGRRDHVRAGRRRRGRRPARARSRRHRRDQRDPPGPRPRAPLRGAVVGAQPASVANFTRDDARRFLDLAAAIPVRTEIETHPLDRRQPRARPAARGEVRGAAVLACT